MAAGVFRRKWFPPLRRKIGLASLNASNTLQGLAATTAFGTFVFDVTQTLSGQVATSSVGTFTPNVLITLPGQQATAARGSFTFQLNQNKTLTGLAATAVAGNLDRIYGIQENGVDAQATIGSFLVGLSTVNISLTGVGAIAQVGSISPSRPVRLQGQFVTAHTNEDAFNVLKVVDLIGLEVKTSPNSSTTLFPAGGGGGGAAGLFGDGEDGGDASNFFGIGGYGGAADNFNVPRQLTPGAIGNFGTEFNGLLGDGSGGGGGSYNRTGPGQSGGDGGNYGGGGGGGAAGRDGNGLGGQGAFGIVYINYISSVTSLLVEIILDKDSASPFVFPADWSGTNTIILVGPGGCGEDGSSIAGGDGGFGGDTVGVQDTLIFNPGDFVDFHVSNVPCGQTPTTFAGYGAAAGANGGGTGGGGPGSSGFAAGGFVAHGGRGGPKGVLSTLHLAPQPVAPGVSAFAQVGMLSSNLPADRTFFIAGIPQDPIPAGIVLLPTSEDLSIVTAAGNYYVVGSSQFYTIGEVHWNGAIREQGVDWDFVAPFHHIVQITDITGIVTAITVVYYRWNIGVRSGFKINDYPVKFGFTGTTILAEHVPPTGEFFTVEYTSARPGDNPRSMFAIFPNMIDDLLPIHDFYDGASGFETYRPIGYKVYDELDNRVWQWNGTTWTTLGVFAPDTYFYVKRLRQVYNWDGATLTLLYTAGDGSSSIEEVLQGPARPYPPYGESIGKNFLQDAFSASAAVDFPAAYEVAIRPGDYDPWLPGV